MRIIGLILTSFLSFSAITAKDFNNYWQKANKYYEQKDYLNAVEYYTKIADQNPDNAAVYFNLGNAYYKLNQIAPAILNYERALRISPGNKQAQDNLSIAQSRIVNRIPIINDIFFIRWAQTISAPNKANAWAIASLLLFSVLIGIAIYSKIKQREPILPVRIRFSLWSVLILCLIFSYVSAYNNASRNRAVVMQDETPMYSSTRQSKPLLYVPEGTTVKCGDEIKGWIEVVLPDGRNGWILKDAITLI